MQRLKAIQAFQSLCQEAESYAEKESQETGIITNDIATKRSRALAGIMHAIYPKEFSSTIFQTILDYSSIKIYGDMWIEELTKKFFSPMLYDENGTLEVECTAMARIDSTRESLSTLALFTSNNKDIKLGMINVATAVINNDNEVRAKIFNRFANQFFCNENGLSITSLAECYRSIIIDGSFIDERAMANLRDYFDPNPQAQNSIAEEPDPTTGSIDPIKYVDENSQSSMILISKEDLAKKINGLTFSPGFEKCNLGEVIMLLTTPGTINPKALYIMSEVSNDLVGARIDKNWGTQKHLEAMEKVLTWFPRSSFTGENMDDSFEKILIDIVYMPLPGNRYKLKTKHGKEIRFVHIPRKEEIRSIVKSILEDHQMMAEEGRYTEPTDLALVYAIRDITSTIWGYNSMGAIVFTEMIIKYLIGKELVSVNADTITNLIWDLVPRGKYWWTDKEAIDLFREFINEENKTDMRGELIHEQHQEKPTSASEDDDQAARPDYKDGPEHQQQAEDHTENQDIPAVTFADLTNEDLAQAYHAPQWYPCKVEVSMPTYKFGTGTKLLPDDMTFTADGENGAEFQYQFGFKIQEFIDYVKACQKAAKESPERIFSDMLVNFIQAKIFPVISINGKEIPPIGNMLWNMMLASELENPQDQRLAWYMLGKVPATGPLHMEKLTAGVNNLEFTISKHDIINLACEIYNIAEKDLGKCVEPIFLENGGRYPMEALVTAFIKVCYPDDSCIMYGTNAKNVIRAMFENLGMDNAVSAHEVQCKLALAILELIPINMLP